MSDTQTLYDEAELVGLSEQLTTMTIGSHELEHGRDQYVHVERMNREPLSVELATAWFLPRVYRDSGGPGAHFCHNVTVVRSPSGAENSCLCVIHHRIDI